MAWFLLCIGLIQMAFSLLDDWTDPAASAAAAFALIAALNTMKE